VEAPKDPRDLFPTELGEREHQCWRCSHCLMKDSAGRCCMDPRSSNALVQRPGGLARPGTHTPYVDGRGAALHQARYSEQDNPGGATDGNR